MECVVLCGGFALRAAISNGKMAINAVSLRPIPTERAVRIGPHVFDERIIRALLAHDPNAKNPLTRHNFPQRIYNTYRSTNYINPYENNSRVPIEYQMWYLNLLYDSIDNDVEMP